MSSRRIPMRIVAAGVTVVALAAAVAATAATSGSARSGPVNGVVGAADVGVNGSEVATKSTVVGAYTRFTFDVTGHMRSGTNSVALEVYPNNPKSMLTLDDVDWNQVPPDNNTGIQFPVVVK